MSTSSTTIHNGRDREITIDPRIMVVRDSAKGTELAVALDQNVRMQLAQALKPTSTEAACSALVLLGNAIRHDDDTHTTGARARRRLRNSIEYLVDQITGDRADNLDQILAHIGVSRTGAFTAPVTPTVTTGTTDSAHAAAQ